MPPKSCYRTKPTEKVNHTIKTVGIKLFGKCAKRMPFKMPLKDAFPHTTPIHRDLTVEL